VELPAGTDRSRLAAVGDALTEDALAVATADAQNVAGAATIELVYHLVTVEPSPARKFQRRGTRRDRQVDKLIRLQPGERRLEKHLQSTAELKLLSIEAVDVHTAAASFSIAILREV
jgi:hypothetical protein